MIATGNHNRFDRCAVQQPSPMYPTRRIAIRPAKMSRLSLVYREKAESFFGSKRPKIGTFLDAGWRCGWGFLRGRLFVAPLKSLSFGTFLGETRKVHTHLQIGICFILADCHSRFDLLSFYEANRHKGKQNQGITTQCP